MTAMSLCTVVLAFLASTPGQTAGWGTGSVYFVAQVSTSEHQEIYPLGAGMYTIEANILEVLDDPFGALAFKTKVDVFYASPMGWKSGDIIEVSGTFYDGASALPYLEHVVATSIFRNSNWEEPVGSEPPENLVWPSVVTGAAEATETTATLNGKLMIDGGFPCRCRFVYQECAGAGFNYGAPLWTTEWTEGMRAGQTLTESIAALKPGTRYFYRMDVENDWAQNYGITGSFVTLEETVPPIPYPALWSAEPNHVDSTSIIMTAEIDWDITGPIEYTFDFVASPTGGAGGTDSTWLLSPTYQDVGLNPNHQYGYRIKARDGNTNETAYSVVRYTYTDIETPTGVTFSDVTTSSIKVKANGTLSGLTRGQSGVKLENLTAGQVSPWQQDNSAWLSDGLLPNTQYGFRTQARNGDGDRTPFSSESRVYTLAMVPAAAALSQGPTGQLIIEWGSNGNPTGTQYWCQNTVTNANSGWISSTQWIDTGLSANVKYGYKVKARNGDGVETGFSATVQGYSAIEPPTGIAFGTPTATTLQVKSANTPSGLDRDSSGLLFENVTTGQTSGWRHDNSYWTTDSLLPNRQYGVRVMARNGDMVQTAWSETAYKYTYANPPAAGAFSVVTLTSIQVQWSANGNPTGTMYMCENTTAGTSSGWITKTVWDNVSLQPNTAYTYRIKARNGDGVDTGWLAIGTQSTDYRSLTVSATAGGQVTAPGQGTYRYAPGASVSVAATPSAGYHFLRWTGTAVDAGRVRDAGAAQTTIAVDAHYTLIANFLRTRIYVDGRSAAGGDGSTWQKAYTYLQDALDTAQAGNEICVAQGIYKPDQGKSVTAGDRTATFTLNNGVRIKGGFFGIGSSDPNARDIVAYPTLLSGDLKGDDGVVRDLYELYSDARRTDNSLHVVTAWDADATTLLEGVTVIGGNGPGGAGLWVEGGAPVISLCTIKANRSGQQSGDGEDGWGIGAGAYCYASDVSFLNCLFQSNWVGGVGGGLCVIESRPTLNGCAFRLNQAGLQGGAIYTEDCNAAIVKCVFQGNNATSEDGGAVYAGEDSDARLTNCSFFGNGAGGSGGAVFSAGRDLRFINSVFSANAAYGTAGGGGMAVVGGSALLTNCTFSRNYAEAFKAGQSLAVTDAVVVLANCIAWDLSGSLRAPIAITRTTQTTELIASYCDIQLGVDGIVRKGNVTVSWGAGNLDADPGFAGSAGTDKVAGTEDDNLRLQGSSPCIDAGNDTAVPADADDLNANGNRTERIPVDVDGLSRFTNRAGAPDTGVADPPLYPAVVDLGAYEASAQ